MRMVRVLSLVAILAVASCAHLPPAAFLGYAEEPSAEPHKAEAKPEVKPEEAKADAKAEVKPEEAKTEEKKEEAKTEEKKEEAKTEEKKEEAKTEEHKEEAKTEEKKEETKTEEKKEEGSGAKAEANHTEASAEEQKTPCTKEAAREPIHAAPEEAVHAQPSGPLGQQLLFLCNAYPDRDTLDVTVGRTPLTSAPLPYKSCEQLSPHLEVSDTLRFYVSGLEVGHFVVSALPFVDSTMVLIVSRANASTQVARFQSHIFAAADTPQVAIFDTFIGADQGDFSIGFDPETAKDKDQNISETLPLNTTQAVPQGIFSVKLNGLMNETKMNTTFIAVKKTAYVLLRTGIEAEVGESFNQSMVLFPQSTRAELTTSNTNMYMGIALVGLAGAILIGFAAFFCNR